MLRGVLIKSMAAYMMEQDVEMRWGVAWCGFSGVLSISGVVF